MNTTAKWMFGSVTAAAGFALWYWVGNGSALLSHSDAHTAAPTKAAPATTVNTVLALRQDVPIVLHASGTVTPLSSVELHPQVTSTIRQVPIHEGQFVRAGQVLFTLDDRSDQANLDKAKAQVVRDQAGLADLERQLNRSRELVTQKFLAQSAVDTLESQVQAQRALQKADAAAVQAAKVNIDYAVLRAPLAGRVGAINVFPGSLVQVSTVMVTITQLHPMAVSFTLPESSLQALLGAQQRGVVAVQAELPNGGAHLSGALSFIDNTVDPQAGVIRVKAQFDNRAMQLWPGQYVNAEVTVQTLKNAVVVPAAAIVSNTRGRFVYSMEPDQSAKSRQVSVLHSFGANAVVSGLNGGEKIVVEGKQNLRPGDKVREAGSLKGGKE
jgi:RND family efflux transporter MFP subunit